MLGIYSHKIEKGIWFHGHPKACAHQLYEALRKYTEKHGPGIMSSSERAVVKYTDRVRPIIVEQDLEVNFPLLKEATLSCFEQMLKHADLSTSKEIPVLAEFEAGPGSFIYIYTRVYVINYICFFLYNVSKLCIHILVKTIAH